MKTPPMRFQIRGVRFLQEHGGRALLGDDMGLGKTYQTIGWLAINPQARPAVVVCPATLKYLWKEELMLHAGLRSKVLGPSKRYGLTYRMWPNKDKVGEGKPGERWFSCPDRRSIFIKKMIRRILILDKPEKPAPKLTTPIVILNYELLEDWAGVLLEMGVSTEVMDECHYVKNQKAQRTKSCKQLAKHAQHVFGLSGTPITNRPVEFFPILNMIAPDLFPSFWTFAMRYCGPKRGFRGRGWDFRGASHIEELHELVSQVMIRRTKQEVLKDLPTKRRTFIPVDITNAKEYEKAQVHFLEWYTAQHGKAKAKRASGAVALVKLGALKELAAQGKLQRVQERIDDFLEETDQKLVVFTTHRSILKSLCDHYPKAVVVHGGVKGEDRKEAVRRFQKDPKCRLFFGTIKAAGVGLTLTAASTVFKVELGWTPTEHDQAEDRVLRIGQTADKVNIYYFIARGTVEEDILEAIEDKRSVIEQVVDGKDVQTEVIGKLLDKWRNK